MKFQVNWQTLRPKSVIIDAHVAEKHLILVNSYAPNDQTNHVQFVKEIVGKLGTYASDPDANIIWRGDHNVALDTQLDRRDGNPKPWIKSIELLNETIKAFDLICVENHEFK